MLSFRDYMNFVDDEKFHTIYRDYANEIAGTQLSMASAMLIGKLVDFEVITGHDVGLCANFLFPTPMFTQSM